MAGLQSRELIFNISYEWGNQSRQAAASLLKCIKSADVNCCVNLTWK